MPPGARRRVRHDPAQRPAGVHLPLRQVGRARHRRFAYVARPGGVRVRRVLPPGQAPRGRWQLGELYLRCAFAFLCHLPQNTNPRAVVHRARAQPLPWVVRHQIIQRAPAGSHPVGAAQPLLRVRTGRAARWLPRERHRLDVAGACLPGVVRARRTVQRARAVHHHGYHLRRIRVHAFCGGFVVRAVRVQPAGALPRVAPRGTGVGEDGRHRGDEPVGDTIFSGRRMGRRMILGTGRIPRVRRLSIYTLNVKTVLTAS